MKIYVSVYEKAVTALCSVFYTEILKHKYLFQALEERKLPKVARLGMLYHIHDIIGAELVQW